MKFYDLTPSKSGGTGKDIPEEVKKNDWMPPQLPGENSIHYHMRLSKYVFARECGCKRCQEIMEEYKSEKNNISTLEQTIQDYDKQVLEQKEIIESYKEQIKDLEKLLRDAYKRIPGN